MKKGYKIAVMGMVIALASCQQVPNTNHEYQAPVSNSITTSVQHALTNNNQLTGLPIEIAVDRNMVQLNGYVKTIRQSDVAAEVVSKVHGVKYVQNNLIVRK
jgi:hyperosmotically inducible protein